MKHATDWLLLAGAVAGMALATAGLVRTPTLVLPDDAVALVNGQPIRRTDFETALAAAAADGKRGSGDPALRRHVLDRLIDEELLVQAALDLGLAQRDRRVRADLSSATLSFLTETPVREPTEAELARFFEENAGYFATDVRLDVEALYFTGAEAEPRARAAREAWQRGDSAKGDTPALPLPEGPLPLAKLEQYLGPTLARSIAALPVGAVSEPLAGADGLFLFRVRARSGGAPPAFETVREQVRAEWRRRETEQRLRRFLAERRARAQVAVSQELGS